MPINSKEIHQAHFFLKNQKKRKIYLLKKIEYKFFLQKLPTKRIGIEKNKDKNSGINIKLKGIKNIYIIKC